LELAGVGSRTAAAALDGLLITALLILIQIVGGFLSQLDSVAAGWATALLTLFYGFALILYYVLLEGFWGGRTIGKRALGIRVVMDTGRAATMSAVVVRNVLRIVDFMLPFLFFAPGILLVLLTKSHKRLGDMAAGTIVVRDRPIDNALAALSATAPAEEPVEAGPPELTEDEFRLLDRFLARLGDLAPEVQLRLAQEMANRFEAKVPRRAGDAEQYLLELFADEQRKRRGRFAARARTGGCPAARPRPGAGRPCGARRRPFPPRRPGPGAGRGRGPPGGPRPGGPRLRRGPDRGRGCRGGYGRNGEPRPTSGGSGNQAANRRP